MPMQNYGEQEPFQYPLSGSALAGRRVTGKLNDSPEGYLVSKESEQVESDDVGEPTIQAVG